MRARNPVRFREAWRTTIAQRYGAQPEISFYDTAVIVENVDEKTASADGKLSGHGIVFEPMPIIEKHHVHPYSTPFFSIAVIGRTSRRDANHALVLPRTGNRLVDQHLPHVCFRRTSPQRFRFRGLWQKPGQRFAVCGGNPAFKQDVLRSLCKKERRLMSQKETLA